ncbi:MAG: hypothetical protein AAGK22_30175 [Acidobacteriota bacterium]
MLVPFLISASLFASPEQAEPARCSDFDRSNSELVSTLPLSIESAMVMRLPALTASDSLLMDEIGWIAEGEAVGRDGQSDERALVYQAALRAAPRAVVLGGSNFVDPEGVGSGRFSEREVIVFNSPVPFPTEEMRGLETFEESTEAELPWFSVESEEGAGFRGKRIRSKQYYAMLGPCTLLSSPTAEELIEMARRWQASDSTHPLSEIELGHEHAPLLISRRLLPPLDDASNERRGRARDVSFLLVLADPSRSRFDLRVSSGLRNKAARAYFVDWAVYYLMGEQDYRLDWPNARRDAYGQLTLLGPTRDNPDPWPMLLVAHWFFGVLLNI